MQHAGTPLTGQTVDTWQSISDTTGQQESSRMHVSAAGEAHRVGSSKSGSSRLCGAAAKDTPGEEGRAH
jgi:hypothetical protein